MLAEIAETDATGEIAGIFAEVRQLWGVPYVSAIQRHMATRPGVLAWAWEMAGPAFRDGTAQQAAWRAVDDLALEPLDRLSADALAVWGVDAAALARVKAAAEGFVRVAPVNMMFAGLIRMLLEGQQPAGSRRPASSVWTAPPPLPAPPSMVALESLDPAARGVLLRLASGPADAPFVPGLYRMLAHWPGLLAHVSTVLGPRLASAETAAACDQVRARIDAALPEVFAHLPARTASHPPPAAGEAQHFQSVGSLYRKTSPELIVFGKLIRDALP